MGDAHVGLQARLMSQALRKLTGATARGNSLVIFINQLRMKIGVMFGSPETTSGGNALKFYASIRLDVRRIGAIKEAGPPGKDMVVVGNRTRVKVVKNKMAPPFKEVEFDILYGQGISREGDLVDLASEASIVEKSGAWFSYGGERIGQGRENAKQFLIEHPDVYNSIEAKVLAHHQVRRIGIDEHPATKADLKDGRDVRDGKHGADGDERAPAKKAQPVAPAAGGAQGATPNGKRPNA